MPVTQPTVSVIIPTRNRTDWLKESIQSVLDQSFRDFEIIVVDDCSTDDTRIVVEELQDGRIRYIRHDTKMGGAAARNTGIKASRAEYIAFLDDDDIWPPRKLELQIMKFEELPDDFGIVYGGFEFFSRENGLILDTIRPQIRGLTRREMLKGCFFSIITALVRKRCFTKAGVFDENLTSCQDWEMWIRITRDFKVDFVPETLARVAVHGGQITADLKAKISGRRALLEKHSEEIRREPRIHGEHLQRLGVLTALDDDLPRAKEYFRKSSKACPTRKGPYLHLLISILAPRYYRQLLERRGTDNLGGISFYY